MPDGCPVPDLMTEDEVIEFLRIPSVSTAKDYHNVILNLIRFRNLPRIKIGKKRLYPRKAILEWIESETIPGKALTSMANSGTRSGPRRNKYR
jgi:hypothetical protein